MNTWPIPALFHRRAGLAVLRNARADSRLRRWVSQFSGDQGA